MGAAVPAQALRMADDATGHRAGKVGRHQDCGGVDDLMNELVANRAGRLRVVAKA